jgi:hypothetical protein
MQPGFARPDSRGRLSLDKLIRATSQHLLGPSTGPGFFVPAENVSSGNGSCLVAHPITNSFCGVSNDSIGCYYRGFEWYWQSKCLQNDASRLDSICRCA